MAYQQQRATFKTTYLHGQFTNYTWDFPGVILWRTPFLHFILGKEITQPQNTHQVIQGMEKFFVLLD